MKSADRRSEWRNKSVAELQLR